MARTTRNTPAAVRVTGGSAPGVAPDARTAAPAPADPPEVKAQSTSPRARKAAAEKAAPARKPAKAATQKPARGKGAKETGGFVHTPKGPDLREDLRAFVQARPAGWDHGDWISFVDHLRERGHDTSDPDSIGLLLERERLAARLAGVQGMGPRRIQAVVERYDTIWSAHQADVDEIATLPGMNRSLAEKVRQALHAA
jgi:hypothetical protein